jgi:tetratricopeptide (TPR) repeat protein
MTMEETDLILNEIAAAIQACKRGEDLAAEKRLQQRLDEIERQVKVKHGASVDLMHALANICRDQYRFAEADRLYERAVELRCAVDPNYKIPGILRLLRDYSTSLCMQGKFAESFEIEQGAMDIAESKSNQSQFEINMCLTRCCALAWVNRNYEAAERYYLRCLENRQPLVDTEEIVLLPLLEDLAFSCHQLGKYADAAQHYRRALSILSKTHGSDAQFASLQNGLGLALCAQGLHSEGQNVCAQASAGRSALPLEDPAQVLNDLADVYCVNDRFDEAKPLCQAAYMSRHPLGTSSDAPLWQKLTAYVETIRRLNFCERTDKLERRIARLKLESLATTA